MALKIGTPNLSNASLNDLFRTLMAELTRYSLRLGLALPEDGSETMTGPLGLAIYAKASLPVGVEGNLIYVSDDTGGKTLAYFDGTNWRRVQDRNIIS